MPKTFHQWQFSTLFVRFLSDSASIPKTVASDFQLFQNKHGIVLGSLYFYFSNGQQCCVEHQALPGMVGVILFAQTRHSTITSHNACL